MRELGATLTDFARYEAFEEFLIRLVRLNPRRDLGLAELLWQQCHDLAEGLGVALQRPLTP